MATSSVKNGAKITTSGDWTWTEFENGMIVAEADVNLGDNIQITDSSYGNFVSQSLSVTTPFSFSSGNVGVTSSKVTWAVNVACTAPNTISLRVMRANSTTTQVSARFVFVGVK